jgi:ATP-binding cassette subfamily B (MDR/TAP) protein 9
MFIRSMIFVIVSFVFLFVLSWQLTLTIPVSISPVIVYSLFFGNVMKKTQKIVQDKRVAYSNLVEESFSNIRTVKAFANEQEEATKFKREIQVVYKVGIK